MYDIQNPLSKLDYRQNPQLMPAPKPLPSAKIHNHLHSAPVSKSVPLSRLCGAWHGLCNLLRALAFSLVPTSAGMQRTAEVASLHNVVSRVSVQSVCCFLCSVRPEAGTVADIRYGGARASSGSLSRAIHVRDTPYRQTGFVITSRRAIANIGVLALRLAGLMLLRSVLSG